MIHYYQILSVYRILFPFQSKKLMPCPAFVVSNHTSMAPLSRSSTRLRQGTCATAELRSYIATHSNSSKSRRCSLTLKRKASKIVRKCKSLSALLEMLRKYQKRKRNLSGFPPPFRYLSRQSPLVCHVKSNGSARQHSSQALCMHGACIAWVSPRHRDS